MKMINKRILQILLSGLLSVGVWSSCSDDFLETPPTGSYSEEVMKSYNGVEKALISAYATLDGSRRVWGAGASNWAWGDVRSEVAYKGSEESDQPLLTAVERYQYGISMPYFLDKWDGTFDGIAQANAVLRFLSEANDIPSDIVRRRIEAEARFIRAHHYFEAVKHWEKLPWLDESVSEDFRISNTLNVDIWDHINKDFQFAYENLPADYTDATLKAISPTLENVIGHIARANKYAAGAYLAKAYVFQQKWTDALPVLNDIVTNGVTGKGEKYALMPNFQDNFLIAKENNAEHVFAIQFVVGVGTQGANGNFDELLNGPMSGPTTCCGFFQPSHNLANSYKTDILGLPLVDTYNENDITTIDEGGDHWTFEYTGTYDPRIDHTIGRVGVPFLDWGPMPRGWIRNQGFGGPYMSKKRSYLKSEPETVETGEWGERMTSNNYTIIRFSDVLLWLAEVQIETSDFTGATNTINLVRARANSAETKAALAGSPFLAQYNAAQYLNSFLTKEQAHKALRFERKLELAMEGHRFYDLARWHKSGAIDLVSYLNQEYLAKEIPRRPHLQGAQFELCDIYFPIPEQAIVNSAKGGAPTLEQADCYK